MPSKFTFSRLKVAEELLSHFQNFDFKKFVLTVYSYWAIYKNQNGESGNGMKGVMGTLESGWKRRESGWEGGESGWWECGESG